MARIGILDNPENRSAIMQYMNTAYGDPGSIIGSRGTNVMREFFLPGKINNGAVVQFSESQGRVVTIIVKD